MLRRYHPRGSVRQQVVLPGLFVDYDQYLVKLKGKEIDLPPREIELLYYLSSHPNTIFTRQQILDAIWGYDFVGATRTVDVHIERLRKKLADASLTWQIKTIWGVGYKLEVKNV